MNLEKVEFVRQRHLKLLEETQKKTISERVLAEVREFIERCRQAGKDVHDFEDREYLRSLLLYWGEFLSQHSKNLEYLDLSLLPFEGKVMEEEAVPIWQEVPVWAWAAAGGGLALILITAAIYFGRGPLGALLALPTATPAPVVVRTATPTVTSTSTPTIVVVIPTPTPTGTLILTDTPSPTNTPTPTFTATPIPPDAVVNVEALNLRSGPGVVYDILGKLKKGDSLKVTAKSPHGNWLKVTCPSGQEGWAAAWLLEINLPVPEVSVAQAPPTPTPAHTPTPTVTPTPEFYPAPIPLEPKDGASLTGWVSLRWQWEGQLKEGEYFSVRVWKEGETEPCHYTQVKDREYSGGLSFCAHDGKHYWSVCVVEKTEEGPLPVWENRSKDSDRRWFYFNPGEEEPWPPEPPELNGKFTPAPP
jgi:hypothetical protein